MKIGKIVDTVDNFGRAEKHIVFDADFERFIKKTYGKKEILNIDPAEIAKKYHLKGFVFGNYVTQEERYHFLFKISKQLEALAKIAGTDNLGKNILIIAFGVEGSSHYLAHYSPSKQLINLNRGRKGDYKNVLQGENSFIHEYGHFIDFNQGRNDKSCSVNFASEVTQPWKQGNLKTKLFGDVINKLEKNEDYLQGLNGHSNTKYLKSRVELYARLFESSLTHYIEDNLKEFAPFVDSLQYKSDWYLSKAEIKKQKLDKDIIKTLKSIKG